MTDQVTLITGAANGIARQLARDLLAQGHHQLVLCDIDHAALQAAFADTAARCYRLDEARYDEWQALFATVLDEYGRIDTLCNIAGVIIPGWIEETDARAIDRHIDVNVKGVMYGSKVAAEAMVRQHSGQIINMASLAGIAFTPGLALYCASKHAVRGFSVALAGELRPKGVYVSCVCPGVAETGMLTAQIDRPEGALSFTTGAPLTTAQVSQLIQNVMRRKPTEACMPSAALLKFINAFPMLVPKLYGIFQRRGLRSAARLRSG